MISRPEIASSPGRAGADELSLPDEANTPARIVAFIESCALFPNAEHDDDVDAWSMAMNWLRGRPIPRGRLSSPFGRGRNAATA